MCSSRPVFRFAATDHAPRVPASAVGGLTPTTPATNTRTSRHDAIAPRRMAPRLSRSGASSWIR